MTDRSAPASVDEYIASFPTDVASILKRIRLTIRRAAPHAKEKISYKMPTFALDGDLIYFRFQEAHRNLSTGAWRPKSEQGAIAISRRQRESEVPSRPTNFLRADHESRQIPSKGTVGKDAIQAKEEIISGPEPARKQILGTLPSLAFPAEAALLSVHI
jgi:hypothetical protein